MNLGLRLARAALAVLPDPVVVIDRTGAVVDANDAWRRLGCERDAKTSAEVRAEVRGVPYREAHLAACGEALSEAAQAGLQGVLCGRIDHFRCALACLFADGVRHLRMSVTPLAGAHRGAVIVLYDVTEQVRLDYQAHHDALTGLPNRRLFFLEAVRLLAAAERTQQAYTVVYLDLDGFKAVNDHNGHETGDVVLRRVAARLRALTRQDDLLARVGGDEFVILLHSASAAESLSAVERYRDSISQPLLAAGTSVRLRGSFGLSHYPTHGRSIGDLLWRADQAMYRAKLEGSGVGVYGDEIR